MLSRLYIKNFALIRELEIAFPKGMLVITGETGAGKSILLGALRLVMGNRAEQRNIGNPEEKCIVETSFQVHPDLKQIFEDADTDYEEETLIRREILPSGKSRAFINDTPVTLEQLKTVTAHLVDIHSQFETSNLFSEDYQLKLLDSLSGTATVLSDYRETYSMYTAVRKRRQHLEALIQKKSAESDYRTFLLAELEEANLDTIQEDTLQSELEMQENAEQIAENCSAALQRIYAEDFGILHLMGIVRTHIKKLAELSTGFSEEETRMESIYVEFQDFAQELSDKAESIEADPEKLNALLHIQHTLNALHTKHQTSDLAGLRALRDSLREEVDLTGNAEEELESIKKQEEEIRIKLSAQATKLHDARTAGIAPFREALENTFRRLGLENARFDISLTDKKDFDNSGKDHIQFLFQANKGFELLPIAGAISGGERSRVMLAVKKMSADYSDLPTLILDEIDTGVSGRIAEEMGKVMREMAENRQVLVISHQPQVAAKAEHQYKVSKKDSGTLTETGITKLSEAERIEEIAKLISGSTLTDAAIQQAQELMK